MSSSISNTIWPGWARTGDAMKLHLDSQPLKLEDGNLTAFSTDKPSSRPEVVQFTGFQTFTFYGPFEAKIKITA